MLDFLGMIYYGSYKIGVYLHYLHSFPTPPGFVKWSWKNCQKYLAATKLQHFFLLHQLSPSGVGKMVIFLNPPGFAPSGVGKNDSLFLLQQVSPSGVGKTLIFSYSTCSKWCETWWSRKKCQFFLLHWAKTGGVGKK